MEQETRYFRRYTHPETGKTTKVWFMNRKDAKDWRIHQALEAAGYKVERRRAEPDLAEDLLSHLGYEYKGD